ncbi:MAG: hypothetical protein HY650_13030 [Acidobacteria bacterium]|nr:hypothetical protein [Acidobacteriota bacterium]
MQDTFTETLVFTLRKFYEGAVEFVPNILAALVIIGMGLVVAGLLKFIVRKILVLAKFDRFCADYGATLVLTRADIRTAPSTLAGRVVFWFVFVLFLMSGTSALGLEGSNRLIAASILYLPRVFAALLILLIGFLVGNFLSRAALLASVNAHLPSPRIVSAVVRFMIAILAFAMALDQLQIASNVVTAAFTIAFGAVMLGLAIAFGLGGQDVARRVLERRFLNPKEEEEPDEISHL